MQQFRYWSHSNIAEAKIKMEISGKKERNNNNEIYITLHITIVVMMIISFFTFSIDNWFFFFFYFTDHLRRISVGREQFSCSDLTCKQQRIKPTSDATDTFNEYLTTETRFLSQECMYAKFISVIYVCVCMGVRMIWICADWKWIGKLNHWKWTRNSIMFGWICKFFFRMRNLDKWSSWCYTPLHFGNV